MKHSHERRHDLPFHWPSVPLRVVLVEPEIPQNTGTIARLCAATGAPLHLVGPLGFRITDRQLRRAGLDYWDSVAITRHADWAEYESAGRSAAPDSVVGRPPATWFFSTRGCRCYSEADYQPGDALVFGSESKGLPDELLDCHAERVLAVPMRTEHVRSLNLANTVAIVLYEALRQINQR